ncbi:hypothetical protein [Corallococcus sp. RDP092CA]|uniref:hypothetical protein n=1 Tax=Corallococcus sp. RDP092CA TaxID=3109369 RepID=UPI0035ADA4E0
MSLKLQWRADYRDLEVELEGQRVGSVEDPLQLEQGVEFKLPDASALHVQLVHVMTPELRVLRNGVPLPDTATDPIRRVRTGTLMLYGLASFITASAMVSFVIARNPVKQLRVVVFNLLFGGVLAALGFFMFKRSRAAPLVAILIYSVDSLFGVYATVMSPRSSGLSVLWGLAFRAIVFGGLIRGFLGASELARREKLGLGAVPPAVGPVAASPATSASLQTGTGPG